MRPRTTARFRKALAALPLDVQDSAREAYRRFRDDPTHPGLRFKKVHPSRPIYSVRVAVHYRAVGVLEGDEVIWFWIGSHDEYERLLREGAV